MHTTDATQIASADAAERHVLANCAERDRRLLGVTDPQERIRIQEEWLFELRDDPWLFAYRDSVGLYQSGFIHGGLAARRTMSVNINGNNINFQDGTNAASVGPSAGPSVAINPTPPSVATEKGAVPASPSNSLFYWNVAIALAIAFFVTWWFCPAKAIHSDFRLATTVFFGTAGAVVATLGWIQFRHRHVFRFLYLAAAGGILAGGAIPKFSGSAHASASLADNKAEGGFAWLFGASQDNVSFIAALIAAVLVFYMAMKVKEQPNQ